MVWEVDINSYRIGILPAFDIFGRDYDPTKNDLSLKFNVGDLIAVRIVSGDTARDPLLTISGENLGKIDSGELVKISPAKIPRLIDKHSSMIQSIESSTGTSITIGQNGLIVLKSENNSNVNKIIKVFKMLDSTTDDSNMEEKIQKILDENN